MEGGGGVDNVSSWSSAGGLVGSTTGASGYTGLSLCLKISTGVTTGAVTVAVTAGVTGKGKVVTKASVTTIWCAEVGGTTTSSLSYSSYIVSSSLK